MISIMLFHEHFLDYTFFQSIRSWGHLGVDVFFFVSGYGIAHSLNKNTTKAYYSNRIVRMLPSCLILGTISLIVAVFIDGILPPKRYYLLIPLSLDKWFICAIVLFYIISPFLYRLAKSNVLLLLMFAYSVFAIPLCFDLSSWWPINWAMERFPVYCVGISLFFLPDIKYDWKSLFIGGISLLLLILIINTGRNTYLYLFFIPTIPIILFFLLYLRFLLQKVHISYVIERVGKCSLELYLIHELVFSKVMMFDIHPLFQLLFGVVMSLFFAFCTMKGVQGLQQKMSNMLSSY